MSDLAKAGLHQLIDVVENTTAAVPVAIDATKDAAAATLTAVVTVGDKTLDAALEEAEILRQQYITSLRRIADAVAGAIPLP